MYLESGGGEWVDKRASARCKCAVCAVAAWLTRFKNFLDRGGGARPADETVMGLDLRRRDARDRTAHRARAVPGTRPAQVSGPTKANVALWRGTLVDGARCGDANRNEPAGGRRYALLIRTFGDAVPEILKDIDAAKREFRAPVLGPLGTWAPCAAAWVQ